MTQPSEHWEPPTPKVTFILTKGWRGRHIAYVSTDGIWAMQDQPRFRAKTEAEALEKAKADARKRFPESIVPDDPSVHRL